VAVRVASALKKKPASAPAVKKGETRA
jgi:hypothetical protein